MKKLGNNALPPSFYESFDAFLAHYPGDCALLNAHKNVIIQQALKNIGYGEKTPPTESFVESFKKELATIIFLNGHLPNFISPNQPNEALEKHPRNQPTQPTDAKNILLHILRGVPFCTHPWDSYRKSPLGQGNIFNYLFTKRDPELMRCIRKEIQVILQNASIALQENQLDLDSQRQFHYFESMLLSLYPFFNPEENEAVMIPQKIGDLWQPVTYHFKKFDISPPKGLLASLLEEEDRIYAYALVPENTQARAHLLLMGTTYQTGQGFDLARLYNFYPYHTVGEGHATELIDEWLLKNADKAVAVTGHSKGADMAMIYAARYPQKITEANCLNPTALSSNTLNRLNPSWNTLSTLAKPTINVFTQHGDPVFLLEKGFLPGTNLYKVLPNTLHVAVNASVNKLIPTTLQQGFNQVFEAHAHHYLGRNKVLVLRMNTDREAQSRVREFTSSVKHCVNLFSFPMEYAYLVIKLLARKSGRYARKHPVMIFGLLSTCAVLVYAGLITTGALLPLLAPIIAPMGIYLTTLLLSLSTAAIAIALYNTIATPLAKAIYTILLAAAIGTGCILGTAFSAAHFAKTSVQQNFFFKKQPEYEHSPTSPLTVLSPL